MSTHLYGGHGLNVDRAGDVLEITVADPNGPARTEVPIAELPTILRAIAAGLTEEERIALRQVLFEEFPKPAPFPTIDDPTARDGRWDFGAVDSLVIDRSRWGVRFLIRRGDQHIELIAYTGREFDSGDGQWFGTPEQVKEWLK